jgi:hypothetical protein
MTDSGPLMTPLRHLLACAFAVVAATAARAAPPIPMPKAPSATEIALEARCKAVSFARHPAGQMATTMRDFEIKRCIKSGGVLN